MHIWPPPTTAGLLPVLSQTVEGAAEFFNSYLTGQSTSQMVCPRHVTGITQLFFLNLNSYPPALIHINDRKTLLQCFHWTIPLELR